MTKKSVKPDTSCELVTSGRNPHTTVDDTTVHDMLEVIHQTVNHLREIIQEIDEKTRFIREEMPEEEKGGIQQEYGVGLIDVLAVLNHDITNQATRLIIIKNSIRL